MKDKCKDVGVVGPLELFWCGCFPQMTENKQKYHFDTIDMFRQVLDGFDTGRNYAPIKEIGRQNEERNIPDRRACKTATSSD
ncbi:MAG: hypothetical protein WAM14_08765 [Candidatus Nitrosopolaris sp.]